MARLSEKAVELNRQIGFQVYRMRRHMGLTALILAEQAGVHRNMINRIESGLGISIYNLKRIAVTLGVSIDDLVSVSPSLVHRTREDDLSEKKAAKVVCGTENLFGIPDPSSARPASTTIVGSSKGGVSRVHNPGSTSVGR